MKILAHHPPQLRNKEHIAIQTNDVWRARCNVWLEENDKTTRGKWIIRDELPGDAICWNCQASERRANEKPEPRLALPCTKPDQKVYLIRRADNKALVHTGDIRQNWSLCHAASKRDKTWIGEDGKASEITCQRCLKSLGLHEGHTPHVQPSGNKMAQQNRDMIFELWYGFTGERHPDDPEREPSSDYS